MSAGCPPCPSTQLPTDPHTHAVERKQIKHTQEQDQTAAMRATVEELRAKLCQGAQETDALRARTDLSTDICGVGLRIKDSSGLPSVSGRALPGVWVAKVLPGGPAFKQGLVKDEDQLVSIDGHAVDDLGGLSAVAATLRGPANTTVALQVSNP